MTNMSESYTGLPSHPASVYSHRRFGMQGMQEPHADCPCASHARLLCLLEGCAKRGHSLKLTP